MTERNREMISSLRHAYEVFNRGDFDAAIEMAHPGIEFRPSGGQAPIRGVDAFRAWMEPDAFESQTLETRDFRVQGNNVLVRQHARALGAGSGIEIELENWVLWTFDDDGLATRAESFLPHQDAEAFEAAGLSE